MRLPLANVNQDELVFRRFEGSEPASLQRVIANAPDVAYNSLILLRSCTVGMEPRMVELAILQQAILSANTYIWNHHAPKAMAMGITELELYDLRTGNLSDLDDTDRIVAVFVAAVMNRNVTDEQCSALADVIGNEALVKLTVLVGLYSMFGLAQMAFDVQ